VAQVVLVHGIAQEQLSADSLEATWLPSLAGGIRAAGAAVLADRLWRAASPGDIETRMAFYGDLFIEPGMQGDGTEPPTTAASALADAIAEEWLRRAAVAAPGTADRHAASRAVALLDHQPDGAQGSDNRRRAVAALAGLTWFAPGGMAFAERFVNRSLRQVTRYFTDEGIREAAIGRVLALVGPETRVIVGHSLGSVVAYEAAHQLTAPLQLMLTLGSPLGLRAIIHQRLRPQPPTVPPTVRRWVNITARDDLIAAESDLSTAFGNDSRLKSAVLVDNGAGPHDATHYLTKRVTGAAIIAAFTPGLDHPETAPVLGCRGQHPTMACHAEDHDGDG